MDFDTKQSLRIIWNQTSLISIIFKHVLFSMYMLYCLLYIFRLNKIGDTYFIPNEEYIALIWDTIRQICPSV